MSTNQNNPENHVPYFSIGITAYNRKNYIKRCVMSCIEQDFQDFEVIVVDDGSSDNTFDILKSIDDKRLKIVRHPTNCGIPDARNTAILNSKGKWLISFDSDWEMLPGALGNLYKRTLTAPEDVGCIGSSFIFDNGLVTPSFIPDTIIDYEGRIKWTEVEGGTDYCRCVKREIYDKVMWPKGIRLANDSLFALDFAKVTKQRIDRDYLAKQYTSLGSVTRGIGVKGIKNLLKVSSDNAYAFDELLRKHGETLNRIGPNLKYKFENSLAKCSFLSGNRVRGLKYILRCLRLYPYSIRNWSILIFGLISKYLLAFVNIYSRKIISENKLIS